MADWFIEANGIEDQDFADWIGYAVRDGGLNLRNWTVEDLRAEYEGSNQAEEF